MVLNDVGVGRSKGVCPTTLMRQVAAGSRDRENDVEVARVEEQRGAQCGV